MSAVIPLGANGLVSFSSLDNDPVDSVPGHRTSGSAYSHIGTVSLLGGLIQATNLAAQVTANGDDATGAPTASLSATTTAGNVTVGGVSVAQGNIPANTTLPMSLSLPVNVAGLAQINIDQVVGGP